MELHREEYNLRKPPNWGEILYQNLKTRAKETAEKGVKPPRPNILKLIASQPVVVGPLDGTAALDKLNEDEQCSFFSQYPDCKSLILKGWTKMSEKVLRCISITMGENLEELDLSYSHVRAPQLDILIARVTKLKVVKVAHCPNIDSALIAVLARQGQKSITELYAEKCPLLKSEPLLYLAGTIGFNPPKLFKLRALDLGECPVEDGALKAVGSCCKQIRFLNLNQCVTLTDAGVIALVKENPKLRLVNLACVSDITNKSVVAIATSCPELQSLNISKCVNVSNKGVHALANNCPKLQALNLSGLIRVNEEPLVNLVTSCLGLLLLNVNGCERVTVKGIKAIVQGKGYIEMGVSFLGFQPVDEHVEKKLSGHLVMLREMAEQEIRDNERRIKREEEERQRKRAELEFKSCVALQKCMWRYHLRMGFWRMWQERRRQEGATSMQRVFRGTLGRAIFREKLAQRRFFLANTPSALKIQRTVRGHIARVHNPLVARAMRDLYLNRRREAQAAIAVRLQATGRRYLAIKRSLAYREVVKRRDFDEHNAIMALQMLGRRYVAYRELKRRKFERARRDALWSRCARKIQKFYNDCMNRYLSKLKGKALMAAGHKKWRMTLLLQRSVRGYFGRCKVNALRIKKAFMNFAATKIQKIFRSARILYWRDMRLNVIAAYALDRQYIERRSSVAASRLRYKQFVDKNRRDSASDSEEKDDVYDQIWVEKFDAKKKKPYWYCEADNIVTYDEPKVGDAHEKAMIGQRVRVYWIVQLQWYEGYVSEFHRRKRRHRIEYDDGDHEWVDFNQEHERVQVQLEDGSWVMYLTFQTEDQKAEWAKLDKLKENERLKKQSWDDVLCWKMVLDDRHGLDGRIMYISTKTGEMRTGAPFSENWVIQDDGIGFPCFFNLTNGETLHEDPRFIEDTDEDINAQREYVLAEATYAMYFCKEFYERYAEAVESGDKRTQHMMCLRVLNSSKPKHMASFLIRATGLYKRQSVMDRAGMNEDVHQQLEYMKWLSARMDEMANFALSLRSEREAKKKETVEWINANSGKVLICPKCKRRTQRHLDFCPKCGRKNIPPFLGPEDEIVDAA